MEKFLHSKGQKFILTGAFLWCSLLCLSFQIAGDTLPTAKQEKVEIGVLAKQGVNDCLERWNPTARYLNRVLPGYSFVIRPLTFDEIQSAIELGEIEFILANPAYYVSIANRYNVRQIATLENLVNGTRTSVFGTVIFTRKDREDIQSVQDLKGTRFMAVEEHSFGGWIMALREFKDAGLDPFRDFEEISFGGTHDRVVFTVLRGKVDAGTVRSDTLEKLDKSGIINLEDLRILNLHEGEDTVPFLSSNRVYPEWPFAKLPGTSNELAKKVTVALLQMSIEDSAAQSAHIAGWSFPAEYGSVQECLDHAGITMFGESKPKNKTLVESRYIFLLMFLSLFLIILVIAGIFTLRSYSIRLLKLKESSKNEFFEHKRIEHLLNEAHSREETRILTHQNEMAIMKDRLGSSENKIQEMKNEHKTILEEKDTLLKEVHHRVRNNLQLILSIINLQKSKLRDEADSCGMLNYMDDIEKRIRAISMTHEFIYESEDLKNIQINVYITTLVEYLKSFVTMEKNIRFILDIEPLLLGATKTSTLGLIVNETVSNSVKYAFSETGEGIIEIRLHKRDDGNILFLLRDNGVGFPDKPEQQKESLSIGISLIEQLVLQLEGEIHHYNNHGAEYRIIFA